MLVDGFAMVAHFGLFLWMTSRKSDSWERLRLLNEPMYYGTLLLNTIAFIGWTLSFAVSAQRMML